MPAQSRTAEHARQRGGTAPVADVAGTHGRMAIAEPPSVLPLCACVCPPHLPIRRHFGDAPLQPKLPQHYSRCPCVAVSCVDCGQTFDRRSAQFHTSCITEADKYGGNFAYAGGGAAAGGGGNGGANANGAGDTIGLSTCAPWMCSLCRVTCTSQETLHGHAQGKKHKSKARQARAKLAEEAKVAEGGAAAPASAAPSAIAQPKPADSVAAAADGGDDDRKSEDKGDDASAAKAARKAEKAAERAARKDKKAARAERKELKAAGGKVDKRAKKAKKEKKEKKEKKSKKEKKEKKGKKGKKDREK